LESIFAFKASFGLKLEEVADKLYGGPLGLLPNLVAYIAKQLDMKMKETLLRCGFPFEVLQSADGQVQLV
jgi:hypothetical protein